MGTQMRINDIRSKRLAYQENKKQEIIDRIASFLTEEEKQVLYGGVGFVKVPSQECAIQRIDSYPCLVP